MSKLYKNYSVNMEREFRAIPVTETVIPEPLPVPVPEAAPQPDANGSGSAPEQTQAPPAPTQAAIRQSEKLMAQAKEEAAAILNEAHRQKEQIREDAFAQAQEEMQKAVRRGYEEGLAQAKDAYEQQVKKQLEALQALFQATAGMQEQMVDEYMAQIRGLIIATARRIIHKELREDDEAFVQMFAQAVEEIKNVDWLTLKVSKQQLELATRNREALAAFVATAGDFKVIEDRKGGEGRFIIETPESIIDFSVDTQLLHIEKIIERIQFDEQSFGGQPPATGEIQ